jgi:tRNA (guanine37-N1)-methyltransferase
MKINILTLFPEYFSSPLETSILDKAIKRQKIEYNIVNIRDFTQDKHQVTDEPPYGGGAGMVMKIEPIDLALQFLNVKKGQKNKKIILTSAKGSLFDQRQAKQLSQLKEITIICGHYEGVDERVAEDLVDEEIRIGDYVLTGGEPAALVMIDAMVRLIPGVLGNEQSLQDESHMEPGALSYPVYTRPEVYKGWPVPPVLLSGHHEKIKKWRSEQRKKL